MAAGTISLPVLQERRAHSTSELADVPLPSFSRECSDLELASFVSIAAKATTPEPRNVREGTPRGEYAITLQIAEQESAGAIVNVLEHRYATDYRFREFMASRVSNAMDRGEFETELKARFREFFAAKWNDKPYDAQFLNEIDTATHELLFRNCGAIQLTDGCSIACSFCGFNAPKGVRMFFSYEDLKRIVVAHAEEFFARNHTFFYHASDPFDWKAAPAWAGTTLKYPDLHKLVQFYGRYSPYVSTAVPKGEELTVQRHFDLVNRISVSFMNQARLKRTWPSVWFQSTKFSNVAINPEINQKTRGKYRQPNAIVPDPGDTIGCIDGVLVTPRGFFNIVQFRRATANYPEGQTTVQIKPEKLKEPLPDGPVPIESLLEQAVVKYHDFGSMMRITSRVLHFNSGYRPALAARCLEVCNLGESKFYAFNAEQGLAVPVSERELRWHTMLDRGSLAALAWEKGYSAYLKEILSLCDLKRDELNPLLFNSEKAHRILQRTAQETLGNNLHEWSQRSGFLSPPHLSYVDREHNPSITKQCAVLQETVGVLRESKRFGSDPLFARFSDEQIAAGLILEWLGSYFLVQHLERLYSDPPEVYRQLKEQAAAVDGATDVYNALSIH